MDLYMRYRAKWVNEPRLNYAGGRVHILKDFETENVDILTIENVYKTQLNYQNLQHLFVMDPRRSMNEGGPLLS